MAVSLEDRFAIDDLFVRYATALDNGDVEGIVSCFTEDGSLESPAAGGYSGRDGIREFANRFARFRERGYQLRHVLSNLAAKVDGDTAHVTAYLMNIITTDGVSKMMPPGRYDCDMRRVNGEWLFHRRLVVLDAEFSLPGI